MEIYQNNNLLYEEIAAIYIFNPVIIDEKRQIEISGGFDEDVFEDTKEMISIFCQTLEDAMTFNIQSDIIVEKELDEIVLSHEEGQEQAIRGIFIALQVPDCSNNYHMITNAPDMLTFATLAQTYIASIACTTLHLKPLKLPFMKFAKHAWDKLNEATGSNLANSFQKDGSFSDTEETETSENSSGCNNQHSILPEDLFECGLAAVECCSMKEYDDFLAWLMNHGYHPDKTVDPRYWDSFCRYLVCFPCDKKVISQHRLKDNIDCVLGAPAIMDNRKKGQNHSGE